MGVIRRLLFLSALCGGVACEPRQQTDVPATANTMVMSLRSVDSGGQGGDVVRALQADPAVYAATFHHRVVEVEVHYDADQATPADLVARVRALGHDAVEGAGRGSYLPELEYAPEDDVAKISRAGEAVRLRDHVVPGKVTVFDFYALWCKPCRVVDAHLRQVLAEHDDVALRRLDVVDFDSPLARKYLNAADALPYLLVYDRRGRRIAAIVGIDLTSLDAAIARARER
jgi:thiol-disulfide isomerase/thioredoxin